MIHIYDIKQSDYFSADLFPEVVNELMALQQRSIVMNTSFKAEVVISFLKNHSIANQWLQTDSGISRLMTSGTLDISHLESLFSHCKQNQKFTTEFEAYIKSKLA